MKVYELIDKLKKYDPSAEVIFIDTESVGHGIKFDGFGGGDGCTCDNCDEVFLTMSDYKDRPEQ